MRVIFVPFEFPDLERDLKAGRFDIAMAGIYASTQRLSAITASMSYYQSPVALFMPTDRAQRFRTREDILAMRNLRLAMSVDPVLHPLWQRLRHADGMHAREVNYWILGRPRTAAAPRWSVVRDVLHWQ